MNVSQCATGAVAPDIYETGRALAAFVTSNSFGMLLISLYIQRWHHRWRRHDGGGPSATSLSDFSNLRLT